MSRKLVSRLPVYTVLGFLLSVSVNTKVFAAENVRDATTLSDVLESVQEHFPLIKAAQADILSKEALVQAAQGAFDPVLEGTYKNRLSGFYDGSSIESFYRQRIPGFSAEVFAGYRRSNGSFPVYEGGLDTNNDGESRIGVSISLFRDRDFDELRYERQAARVDVRSQRFALQQEVLNTLEQAYIAYAQWLQAARLLSDYSELLAIAEDRAEGVRRSVESGDTAEILLVDNELAVLQRQSLVVDAERLLDASAYRLSLYYRYEDGGPRLPVYTEGLTIPDDNLAIASDIDALLNRVSELDPRIARARLSQEKEALDIRLAENMAKPRVDLRLYNSRDFGNGITSLQGAENVADISFSFPLATNTARGKANAARSNINGLDYRIRQYINEIRAGIEIALINLDATRDLENIALQELESSLALAEAEARRFEAGLSDFFQLNQREQVVAEAELKRWRAHFEHQVALANFYRVSMNMEALGIDPSTSF